MVDKEVNDKKLVGNRWVFIGKGYIETPFLYRQLNEEIYMRIPEGYENIIIKYVN